LLRRSFAAGDGAAERVATFTLDAWRRGNLLTRSGAGSRATAWTRVADPHFEKMLYDNGPLLRFVFRRVTVTKNRCSRAWP